MLRRLAIPRQTPTIDEKLRAHGDAVRRRLAETLDDLRTAMEINAQFARDDEPPPPAGGDLALPWPASTGEIAERCADDNR